MAEQGHEAGDSASPQSDGTQCAAEPVPVAAITTPDNGAASEAAPAVEDSQPREVGTPTAASGEQGDAAAAGNVPDAEQPKLPVGRLHRTMGVSVKTDVEVPVAKAAVEEEAPELSQQQLEAYWNDMLDDIKADQPKLAEQLRGRELRMEGVDMFDVVVNNSYIDAEIRPHLIRMLTILRQKSGRPKLNCRVVVEYQEQEALIYAPRDKYDAMLRSNPALEAMRQLFPEVDY